MFERFTGNARRVVVTAQEEARRFLHDYIGTEHLLLGLFEAQHSVAARALRQVNLTRDAVREDVESIVGRGDKDPRGHIPFTPRAKKVLELALREALNLKHNHIGTEHILLALVREGEGVAAQIMAQRAHDLDRVRGAVLAQLGQGEIEDAPATSAVGPERTGAAENVISAAQALAGGAPLGSHHLLEALVRSEGSMAAQVLAGLGIDPEKIAAKVDALDPDQTTDSSPEESAARKMELRLEGGNLHVVLSDESTVALARVVSDLAGGTITATGPITGAFVPLWSSTNDLLRELHRALSPEEESDVEETGVASRFLRRVIRDRLQRRS